MHTLRTPTATALLGAAALLLGASPGPARAAEPAPTQYTTFSVPDPVYGDPDPTVATGINASGQIVGSYQDEDLYLSHGFVLDHGAYTTVDVPLPDLQYTDTYLSGVSDRGDLVGSYDGYDADFNFVFGAFLLSGGVVTPISPPGAVGAYAYGVNTRGQVVGASYTADYQLHAFLFDHGTYTTVAVPGAPFTLATGINARGQIVGTYQAPLPDGRLHGFLLDHGVYTTIDVPDPAARGTQLRAINDRGEIVGNDTDREFRFHGFVLSGGAFTPIDVPGAFIETRAEGINARGQIVGTSDDLAGFVLTR